MPASSGTVTGRLAGRYAIERVLGEGATAVVYLARDTQGGGTVAIKLLRPELADSSANERFLREIRRTAQLSHPRILPVLDSGEHEGRPYYVLPYMEGGTLRQRLKRERQLDLAEAISITRTVAEALDYAHERGLIHRDVKPENILFGDGQACLGDFGIARALERVYGDSSTSANLVRGTPAYMSPEQAAGAEDYDGRSDIYSLACVFYEMVTGMPAFIGPTPESVIAQRFAHPPRELRVYRPTVPEAIEHVLGRALALQPADRYRTAGAFVDALDEALQAAPPAASHTASLSRRRRLRRARIVAGVLAIAALGLGLWNTLANQTLAERDWILVADFEGPADDPELTSAVRELVTAELNQSPFLSTLSRSQLNVAMRLAGVPETTRVGRELARELAYRSAVRAVLVGSVTRTGSNYSIVLNAVDVADGSNILWVDGVATEATLIPTVQTLVRQARSRLGERRSSIEAALPLDQVATPSFPAYRKYAEGLRLQARGDGVGSNRLMREALALDTGFASAWFSMGWNYQNERMMDSARWAFSQAMARRSRLSDAQRYRLEADAAYAIDYDIAGAIRAYDLYLTTTPGSWAGHNNRGNYLIALGRYEDALESFERAVKAHPFGPQRAQIQVMNQAATLIALGRLADAERLARDLDGHFGTYIRLMRGAAADDWDGVDSLARLTATAPSTPAWLRVPAVAITAGARARRGAVRSADSLLSAGGASASPDAARWFFRARLLLAHAAGVPVPPVPASLRRDVSPTAIITVGLGAAMRGDTVAARTALAGIARADSVELKRLGHGPALIEAWIAARAGNWDRVLDLIGPAARQGEHDTSLLDRVGSQSLRLLAADALAATGRTREFEEMMALLLLPQRMSGNEFALRGLTASFAQLRLARALHRQQRTREADEHRRAAAAVLREPDPDVARIWADVLSQTAR